MSHVNLLLEQKQQLIERFSCKNNLIATWQLASTLVLFVGCWWLAVLGWSVSVLLAVGAMIGIVLVLLRVFVLMHECGHNALFDGANYNKVVGFFLGVLCGMPQYVWSKHHDFHHATNGNWDRYRGPLGTLSLDEYNALSPRQQRIFRLTRSIAFAPVGGFLYLVFSPRYTWLKGSWGLLRHTLREKRRHPDVPLRQLMASFKCRYWKCAKEYRHMTANNLVLLAGWGFFSWLAGPEVFFTIYAVTMALAGGGGIILFAVQHNFEGALAADEDRWNYNRAAIEGTSFLQLPGWLNWFTADIAYHHIHHLSARIPNYNLAKCHRAYAHLFTGVPRITLWEIPRAVRNNLWDVRAQHITSPSACRVAAQREVETVA